MSCVFCEIINKKPPKEAYIYEDEKVVVIKDIRPSAPIHYLAIPKEHISSIMNLEDGHQEIVSALIFAAKKTAEKLNLKGYKLVFNVGREGGQIIDHLHLHILGGWRKKEDADKMPE